MGIDIVEVLQAQAESLAEHHDELRALSVNVANLQELVRVQHEALVLAGRAMNHMGDTINNMDAVTEDDAAHFPAFNSVVAALAKYNEMMGEK